MKRRDFMKLVAGAVAGGSLLGTGKVIDSSTTAKWTVVTNSYKGQLCSWAENLPEDLRCHTMPLFPLGTRININGQNYTYVKWESKP